MNSDQFHVKELGKASRRTAWLSLIGVLVVLISLGYSAYKLNSLEKVVLSKKAEVSSLEELINNLKKEELVLRDRINRTTDEYNELRKNVEKLYSVKVTPQNEVYELKAIAKATGKNTTHGPEYNFTIYINSPPELLNNIKKVTYDFNHPTFKDPHREVSDPKTRFACFYVGWGCLDSVVVKVFLKDNTEHSIDFDMCKSLGPGWY